MKPIIGIMAHIIADQGPLGQSHVGNTYVASVSMTGGIPIIVPSKLSEEERTRIIELCDGFLFSGGIDISPSFYNDDPHQKLGETNLSLDQTQIPMMQEIIKARKPVLGICRGHQVFNVACGGTMYQDISEIPGSYIKHMQQTGSGDISHRVTIKQGSLLHRLFGDEIMVNSYHHQAVKDIGKGLIPVAYSPDGVVEAIELEDYPFGLGIQWHPEAMFAVGHDAMRPIFEAFIQAASK